LEFRLIEWLMLEHSADPFRSIRPPDLILSLTQRTTLIRADPSKTAQDITALLDESVDWDAEWSAKTFEVISQFNKDYARITEQSITQRK